MCCQTEHPIFTSDFSNLRILFLVHLPKSSSILLIFSKNQLLVSPIIAILFSTSLISTIILIISFMLALGLVCSFSSSLSYIVNLLIWDISCFFSVNVYSCTLSHYQCFYYVLWTLRFLFNFLLKYSWFTVLYNKSIVYQVQGSG